MNNTKNLATYFLSASLFSIAAALTYFTFEVSRISRQIPDILEQVENTSETIEPVIQEVNAIQQQIPHILKEVEETRKLIPPIVAEVSEIRKQVPAILTEVKNTREAIPPILQEVEATRKAIPPVLAESAAIRKQIPPILEEVKDTREAIPGMLNEGQNLVDSARTAGQEASRGAVTGVITGIFTAPFAIVGNIGKGMGIKSEELEEYTDEDLNLFYKASEEVLLSSVIGTKKTWTNPKNDISGVITLKGIDTNQDRQCKTIHFVTSKNGSTLTDETRKVCRNKEGKWDVIENND